MRVGLCASCPLATVSEDPAQCLTAPHRHSATTWCSRSTQKPAGACMASRTRKRQKRLSHRGRKKAKPRVAQGWSSTSDRKIADRSKPWKENQASNCSVWEPLKTTGRACGVRNRELLRSHPPNQRLTTGTLGHPPTCHSHRLSGTSPPRSHPSKEAKQTLCSHLGSGFQEQTSWEVDTVAGS